MRQLCSTPAASPSKAARIAGSGPRRLSSLSKTLQTIALEAAPGMRHIYRSGNYNVLGRIIEVVSGSRMPALSRKMCRAPSDATQLYIRAGGPAGRPCPGLSLALWRGGAAEYTHDLPQVPSGFLIASAEDEGHFLIAQLNGGRFGSTTILSPQGIAAAHAPGVAVGDGGDTYGLGWRTGSLGGVPWRCPTLAITPTPTP